ncbi:hypothetical protein CDAR_222661 [Caerostris darwini]|uniref:Uncharacterized protein n=1 Tax=Caerostris darwini TaxID=1538125 RepID=A0AAV4NJ92_9ARAC|nr:hypothetical protein CDAR_222661 [Caerostris darwini]
MQMQKVPRTSTATCLTISHRGGNVQPFQNIIVKAIDHHRAINVTTVPPMYLSHISSSTIKSSKTFTRAISRNTAASIQVIIPADFNSTFTQPDLPALLALLK